MTYNGSPKQLCWSESVDFLFASFSRSFTAKLKHLIHIYCYINSGNHRKQNYTLKKNYSSHLQSIFKIQQLP